MSEWIEKRLDEIAYIEMGQSPDGRFYNSEGNGTIFLQGCTEFGKIFPKSTVYTTSVKKIAPKGSVLFSVRAPVGKINKADQIYAIGRGIAAIIPQKVNFEYLLQLFLARQHQGYNSQGSTFDSINSDQLNSLKIRFPSDPNEQVRIAHILSTVDAAIAQTEALIAKYGRVRTGLMQDLLTKGIDEQGRIRSEETHAFKDSPLGRVPVEWEVLPIGEICEMILGKMLNKEAKKGKEQFEYLGNRSVQWGKFDFSNLEEMSFTAYEREKLKLLKNDVLMCEGGEVGRCAIWEEERVDCYFQKAIHRLRFNQNQMNSDFFVNYFKTLVSKGFLKDYVSQTSIAHLTQEKLATIPVVRPGIDEQLRISKALKKIGDDNSVESAKLKKLQTLKKALMQDLLSGSKN